MIKKICIFSRKAAFNIEMVSEIPNLPPITEVFYNPNTAMDKHLITENPYTSIIEHQVIIIILSDLSYSSLYSFEILTVFLRI